MCGEKDRLNAHHIESYQLNPYLRYEVRAGIACCPYHHKWGRESFHKSFLFTYKFMMEKRKVDLDYLLEFIKVYDNPKEDFMTKKYLEEKIIELSLD